MPPFKLTIHLKVSNIEHPTAHNTRIGALRVQFALVVPTLSHEALLVLHGGQGLAQVVVLDAHMLYVFFGIIKVLKLKD